MDISLLRSIKVATAALDTFSPIIMNNYRKRY